MNMYLCAKFEKKEDDKDEGNEDEDWGDEEDEE